MAQFLQFGADFLDRVRTEVDLPELIERDVGKLKRCGKNFTCCCPFHEEKTPSFNVSPDKNTYHCFGCGAKGDAIEWMRNKHGMSFQDAVSHLANTCGLSMPKENRTLEDVAYRKRLAGLYQALTAAAKLYAHGLNKNPQARAYLQDKRGLSAETIKRFGLGAVATGVTEFLGKSSSKQVLIDSGLAAEREDGAIYDRFRHRVMLPIHTESGNLIGFSGRSMIDKPDKTPKYMNSPETDLFHKGRELYAMNLAKPTIRESGTVVIVEGYFDVISLHQAGDERAVAPMGTALTNQQLRRALAHADTIVFAFDGDAAGRKAALSASAVLLDEMKDGQTGKFLFLPEGDDPDTFVKSHGLGAWLDAVEDAKPLSAVLSECVSHGMDRDLPESQVKAAMRAKAILDRIAHADLFRSAMQTRFSEIVGFPIQPGEHHEECHTTERTEQRCAIGHATDDGAQDPDPPVLACLPAAITGAAVHRPRF